MYNIQTWPLAGRNQLEKMLLQSKVSYLKRCLSKGISPGSPMSLGEIERALIITERQLSELLK
jgi:hypothetical protein